VDNVLVIFVAVMESQNWMSAPTVLKKVRKHRWPVFLSSDHPVPPTSARPVSPFVIPAGLWPESPFLSSRNQKKVLSDCAMRSTRKAVMKLGTIPRLTIFADEHFLHEKNPILANGWKYEGFQPKFRGETPSGIGHSFDLK
jgi:hypothetical protein